MRVKFKTVFSAATAAASLLALSVHAQTLEQSGWKYQSWPRDKDDVFVCLIPQKASAGRGAAVHWTATVDGTGANTQCLQEHLRANLAKRLVYLAMPNFTPGGYQAGTADGYCPSPTQAYGPCTSAFFTAPFAESRAYRKLDTQALARAINESGFLAQLETQAAARETGEQLASLEAYRSKFAGARTPRDVHKLEREFQDRDPEGLAAKAWARVEEQERSDFAQATTAAQLQTFLSIYRNDDKAGLVSAANEKLTQAKATESAAADVRNYETSIGVCRRQMAEAQQLIAREKEVAALSGATSLARLHAAGDVIVSCRQSIPEFYARYRKAGGKLALVAIQ